MSLLNPTPRSHPVGRGIDFNNGPPRPLINPTPTLNDVEPLLNGTGRAYNVNSDDDVSDVDGGDEAVGIYNEAGFAGNLDDDDDDDDGGDDDYDEVDGNLNVPKNVDKLQGDLSVASVAKPAVVGRGKLLYVLAALLDVAVQHKEILFNGQGKISENVIVNNISPTWWKVMKDSHDYLT